MNSVDRYAYHDLMNPAHFPGLKHERRDLVANGLPHRVHEWRGEGVPRGTALLLHGFMDAGASWELVAPALCAAGYRVLAPDLRGFGEGPRAPAGSYYHFPDYVLDTAEIASALVADGEPLHVVGHSMGGTVATLFAGTFPERVASLALLEGIGPPDNPYDVAPDRMRRWVDDMRRLAGKDPKPIASMEDALRRLRGNHAAVAPDVLAVRAQHLVRPHGNPEEGAVAWRFDDLHRATSPFPFYAKAYEAFARRVACPVLFVSGGPDGFHTSDEDERLATFTDVRRVDLGGGHMMHWTRPEQLGRALVELMTLSSPPR
jgi:pimeloyl-ACP methyl ester carboxylesterase